MNQKSPTRIRHYSINRDIRIGGRRVNIYLARIVYRCQQCFGELKLHGAGLQCQANPEHRGFIHRDDIKPIQEKRAKAQQEIQTIYKIKNGKVVIK